MEESQLGIFLRRPELFENESMFSYLFRLTTTNHYDSLKFLISILTRYYKEKVLELSDLPTKNDVNNIFSELLGFSPSTIANSTFQRFNGLVSVEPTYGKVKNWKSLLLPNLDDKKCIHIWRKVAFCPYCLQDKAYFRIHWDLHCVTSCLDHECMLIDKCPKCHALLCEEDVINCKCPNCSFDIRDTKPEPISGDPDSINSISILYNWFGISNKDITKYNLPEDSAPILYRVFSGLVGIIRANREWNEKEPMIDDYYYSPENYKIIHPFSDNYQQNTRRINHAMKVLIDWPNGFYKFLNSFSSFNKRTEFNVDLGLGLLYSDFIDRHWARISFIQSAYNSFLLENQPVHYYGYEKTPRHQNNPSLVDNFQYMDIQSAIQKLFIHPSQLNNLQKSGYLEMKESEWKNMGNYIYYKKDVMTLAQKRNNSVNLFQASELLGTEDQTVLGLVNQGYLEAVGGKTIDGAQNWLITLDSIHSFIEKIELVAKKTVINSNFQTLGALAKKTSILGTSMVDLINYALNDEIHAFTSENGVSSFQDIFFSPDTYFKIKQLLLTKNHWITLKSFAKAVNVKPSTVLKWRRSKLIKPVVDSRSICFFSQDTLTQFQNEFITSNQASQILGIGPLTVQKWARNGRLTPISGSEIDSCHDYRFKRSDVELLSQEKRITAPQMAKIIGLSRSQMCQWIKKGKVTPISGPGIDGMKHYLFVE